MHKLLLDIPTRIETERLYLRAYQAGDGPWYHALSQKNKAHLARYESDNPVMTIHSVEEAEIVMRDFAVSWTARNAFFMGAFLRDTQEFVAQIYIGVVNWDLPEFELGYFANVDHEGRGYVTEASKGALDFMFTHLGAYRVRLMCDDTNLRSARVAERCRMLQEAHIRENHKHADGSVSGTLQYGILKSEWLLQK